MNKIYINTDGGSRGNPGPAAIGVVFYNSDEEIIYTHKECIGVATNNEAEYTGIIRALEILAGKVLSQDQFSQSHVVCRLDSQLVVEQICGRYKIKKDHILALVQKVLRLKDGLSVPVEFVHIPREQNKDADKLVNEALDAEKNQG